jgi:uncharacterized membrane protein
MMRERGMINRNFADLYATAALAVIAAVATCLPIGNSVVLSLFALPLVFLLPGYSLTAALFPKGNLGFVEKLTFTVGLGLAADIIGGLILNVTSQGLTALPWTIFLVSVTLGGCTLAALSRRQRLEPSLSRLRLSLSVGQILVLGLSVVMVASALMIARDQAAQPSTSFTELWIRPANIAGQNVFNIGIRNSESRKMEYQLKVQGGGDLIYEASAIVLSPGETWERDIMVEIPVNGNVQALLYRADDPTNVYRQVLLWSGEN